MEVKAYYPWLEDALRELAEHEPTSICMVAMCGDLQLTTYYNCTVANKYEMISAVHADIVMDTVRANIEQIKDAFEEDDDEQEEA